MEDTYRITKLEDTYFRVPWYVEVASGTTGRITPPTGGTIVLNQWAGSVSAKSSTITVSEKPTGIAAKTAAGADITVTMSSNGSWALSGTPSAYPIAIIYYYDVKLFNFNQAYSLDTTGAANIHLRSHALDDTADHTIGSLTNTYLVKSDGSKLVPATNTDAQVSAAVTASHAIQHAITSTSDHTSTATSGKMLKADANGLPVDASNTDTEVASAVSLKKTFPQLLSYALFR